MANRLISRTRPYKPWVSAALGLNLILLALLAQGCGGGDQRSAEAYCRAFYVSGGPLHPERTDGAVREGAGPLTTILTGASVRPPIILEAMSEHAPSNVSFASRRLLSASRHSPLARLSREPSYARVDAYLRRHCSLNSSLGRDLLVLASGQ